MAKFPELWGANRVAEELGIRPQNIDKLPGLPPERYGPDCPPPYNEVANRHWSAAEIRAFAKKLEARRAKDEARREAA